MFMTFVRVTMMDPVKWLCAEEAVQEEMVAAVEEGPC